jgi:hypothetical protein
MPEELVIKALQRGFWSQPPASGLLMHCNRGGQYCGNVYRKLLHDHEVLRSTQHNTYRHFSAGVSVQFTKSVKFLHVKT